MDPTAWPGAQAGFVAVLSFRLCPLSPFDTLSSCAVLFYAWFVRAHFSRPRR